MTKVFHKMDAQLSYIPISRDAFGRSSRKSNRRPDFRFRSSRMTPKPFPFIEQTEAAEAADLADDSFFYKKLNRLPASSRKAHSSPRSSKINRDVILFHNSGGPQSIQIRPGSNEDNDDDDDDSGSDEQVKENSDEESNEGNDDEFEAEKPNVDTQYHSDYELFEEIPPQVVPVTSIPRRSVPPIKPVKRRDPTHNVINASGRSANKLTPRRRQPLVPCNQNHSATHHQKTKIVTTTQHATSRVTKKFDNPEELFAEIDKIIDRKSRNYDKAGDDKTHWELKIVPTQKDQN